MNPKEAFILGIFVILVLVILGTVGSNTLGTIANSTKTACNNCSSDSKLLLSNTNVFFIVLIFGAIVGGAIIAVKSR